MNHEVVASDGKKQTTRKARNRLSNVEITRVGLCAQPAVPEAEFLIMKSDTTNVWKTILGFLAGLAKSRSSTEGTLAEWKDKYPEAYEALMKSVEESLEEGAGNDPEDAKKAAKKAVAEGEGDGGHHYPENMDAETMNTIQKRLEGLEKRLLPIEEALNNIAARLAKQGEQAPAPAGGAAAGGGGTKPDAAASSGNEAVDLDARVADLEAAVAALIQTVTALREQLTDLQKEKGEKEEGDGGGEPEDKTAGGARPSVVADAIGVVGKAASEARRRSVFHGLIPSLSR